MPDNVQTMPNMEYMVKAKLTPKEALNYYRNIWTKNMIARAIDVQCDINSKAKNPNEPVPHEGEGNREVTVKERLEFRKILLQDAVDLLAAIDKLNALSDEELPKFWGTEALAVADDMLPPSGDIRLYEVLKDFGDVKAGTKDLDVRAWSQKQIDQRVAEGVIQLYVAPAAEPIKEATAADIEKKDGEAATT